MTLTEDAQKKVLSLMEGRDSALALRIYVAKGGCSGYSYGMALDIPRADDARYHFGAVEVAIDPDSAPLLEGVQVDYVEALMGGGFAIENPNAAGSCGCGQSFRTRDDKGAPAACSH